MDMISQKNGIVAAGGDVMEHPPSGDKYGLIDNELGTAAHETVNDASPSPTSAKETLPLARDQRGEEEGTNKCYKKGDGLKMIVGSSLAFAVVVTTALIMQIYLGPPQVEPHGAVSSESKLCSVIGTDALKAGGSAVDAAIATMFCVGVVSSHHSGIGGGHFMVVHDHKTSVTNVIDARETAPMHANKSMFVTNPASAYKGGNAVAVPGELRGMKMAHDKYGSLSWRDLVMPAVKVARGGFKVNKGLAHVLDHHMKLTDFEDSPELAKIFIRNGKFLQEGDIIKRPKLGDTLERIANEGIEPFYSGTIADDIIKKIQKTNGRMTKDDLKGYKAILKPPVKSIFNDYTIYTVPAPSSGPALLLILNIMKGYNLTMESMSEATTYGRLIEALKFGYGERLTLADPAMNDQIENITQDMISDARADAIRLKIDDTKTFQQSYYSQFNSKPSGGTSHISVVDTNEMFVSVTSSINYWFGSKLMTEGGIILNNEMADFSIPGQTSKFGMPPSPANEIAPGKRPLSSMVPTLVMHTEHKCGPRIAVGATNGTKIISGVVEVLLNYLVGQDSLSESIDRPRIHNQLFPDVTEYEKGFPQTAVTFLKGMGNTVQLAPEAINIVSAIAKVNDTIKAHVDYRSGGGNYSQY
ncbi:glutathione hydrolase 1 proenzyme-like isoform X2 [Lineus longissimus]|uniref:glutathione hydrolase 1 proenzyme-like isoform X2 n=1 Tax=Lineus longissimus TaxID=88925 RepID=UPI002B4EF02B